MSDEMSRRDLFSLRTIKDMPVIGPSAKFLKRNLIKALPWYLRGTLTESDRGASTIFDFKSNMNGRDLKELKITKLDPQHSLVRDRIKELKSFYGIGTPRLWLHYLRNGTPNTSYYRYRMESPFSKYGTDVKSLKKGYEISAFMQANRYMLTTTKYKLGLKFLRIVQRLNMDPKEIKVLDYGCGVADPSLLLALHGASVTLVDLTDSKFEFAAWRFKKRGLQVDAVGATETENPVD